MDIRSLLVLFRVTCDAEVSKVCHNFLAYERAVLADAGCESDHVHAVHGCCVGADVLGNSVAECVYGQLSVLVAAKISLFQIAEVGGEAVGQSEDAGLLVEDIDYLCSGQVLFACDEVNDRGIEVAASGAHDQTLKRSKAHGCVHALAVQNCGDAGAVAKVADDRLAVIICLACNFRSFLGYEGVAGSVEAVSSDLIISVVIQRKRIHICLLGHCLMESGIKNCHHRCAGHQSLARVDTDQVCGIVKRSQVGNFLDRLYDFIRDDYGRCELLAAVDDSVADCADLAQGFENAGLVIGQRVKHQADCLVVIGHGDLIDFLAGVISLILVCDAGTVHADSLAKALGKKFLRLSIDDLELQ